MDQPVSGILVFALNQKSAAVLSTQINEKTFSKKYYAVVEGIVDNDEQRLKDRLIKDKKNNIAIVTNKDDKDAKTAELKYRVVKRETDRLMTLLDIELLTGRFHQIRCQLSNMGHPILNDEKYGANIINNKNNNHSIALCAYVLCFKHPVNGKEMEFSLDLKSSDFLDKYR